MYTRNVKQQYQRWPQEKQSTVVRRRMAILFLFVLGFTGFCKGALPLPSYIEPCALSDPNFKQCVVEHARKTIPHIIFTGDKKYKVPVLEPLEVTEIRIDQGASQVGLSLTIRDCKIYGIKDMHIEDVNIDFEKNQMLTELHLPKVVILGTYNASGRILLLPVFGNGDINITLTDVVAKFTNEFKKVTKKDGLEYFEVYNPSGNLEVSRMYVKVDNLFNGDKILGEQLNTVINDNWKDVFVDMEPAIKQTLVAILDSILNGFVGLVPFDQVFPHKIP